MQDKIFVLGIKCYSIVDDIRNKYYFLTCKSKSFHMWLLREMKAVFYNVVYYNLAEIFHQTNYIIKYFYRQIAVKNNTGYNTELIS